MLDLPEYLLNTNLYHALKLAESKAKVGSQLPSWNRSILEYALRQGLRTDLAPPVAKLIQCIVKTHDVPYQDKPYSLAQYTFDSWWDVVHGSDRRASWQISSNLQLAAELDALRKSPKYQLTLR